MKLKEPIDDVGLFWRAGDDQRNAVSGRLTTDEAGRTSLETWGEAVNEPASLAFIDVGATESPQLRLHGICRQLGPVTLDECLPDGYQMRTFGKTIITRYFFTRSIYCGVLFDEDESIVFDRGFVQIEGIVPWMRKSGLQVIHDETFSDTTLSIKSPETIHTALADDLDLKFRFQGTIPTPVAWSTEIAIERACNIELVGNEPLSRDDFREIIWRLTSFFAFVTDMPVAPTSILCIVKATAHHPNGDRDIDVRTTIYDGHSRPGRDLRISHPSFMLVDYDDCAEEFETILQQWWTLATDVPVAIRLIQNGMYQDDAWLNEQFLDLTRAIEVLHRHKFQKESISLARRIRDEIQPFEDLFGGTKACHQLATSTAELRNKFTHPPAAQQAGTIREGQLLRVYTGLEVLVRLMILNRLFTQASKVLDLIKTSQPIHRRLSQCRGNFEVTK